jgi:hypothetical protein
MNTKGYDKKEKLDSIIDVLNNMLLDALQRPENV